jgi:prevent-host-death family protein
MSEQVGIRALQQNASQVVARATAGHRVEITDHGRPVAQLIPIGLSTLETLTLAGLARPAAVLLRDLPEPLDNDNEISLGEILAEIRKEER